MSKFCLQTNSEHSAKRRDQLDWNLSEKTKTTTATRAAQSAGPPKQLVRNLATRTRIRPDDPI